MGKTIIVLKSFGQRTENMLKKVTINNLAINTLK